MVSSVNIYITLSLKVSRASHHKNQVVPIESKLLKNQK